jgi:ceramide glucosyltransferase
VFGVQDAKDPAIESVKRLKARFPDADIELVIDTELHGTNRKVSNLINMARCMKHDVVVLSDSDISVSRNWLAKVVTALEAPGVGAVTCLYAGQARGNGWSVISAMGATYEFLPNVIAGVSWGLASPCLGSTIALKRRILEKIGGLRAFADHLADDYEIGRAVRSLGLSVSVPAFVVDHASPETRWSTYYRHELRWNRTTRVINWMGHTGSVITHAVPLGVLAAIFSGFTAESAIVLAAALSARLWLKWRVELKFGTYAGPALVLPARDIISFVVYLASFFGEDVHWRGTRFQVSQTGALVQS